VVLLLMPPNREPAVSLLARPQREGISVTLQRA
jgi:hypothetical protein